LCVQNVKRTRTSIARKALLTDHAAEHSRNFATDRKSKTGPAKLATRRAVRLLERLEYQSLFVFRYTHAGICYRKSKNRRAAVEHRVRESFALVSTSNVDGHGAFGCELESVREKVSENLFHFLSVRSHRRRDVGRNIDFEDELFLLCDCVEAAMQRVLQLGERHVG